MESHCPYCKKLFSNTSNIPIALDCGHTICNNCVDFLSIYQYPQTCPIDNIKAIFNNLTPCQKTLNYIQNLCPVHNLEMQSLCTKHTTLICKSCELSHLQCEKIKGNPEQINEELKTFTKKAKKKALDFAIVLENERDVFHPECLAWVLEECQEEIQHLKSQIESLDEKSKLPEANLLEELYQQTENIKNRIFIKRNSEKDPIKIQIENFLSSGGNFKKLFKDIGIPECSEADQGLIIMQLMKQGKIKFKNQNVKAVCKTAQEVKDLVKTTREIMFFINEIVVNETNANFAAYFGNIDKIAWNIIGIGIGCPLDSSGFVFVNEMRIFYENDNFLFENFSVEYVPGKMTNIFWLGRGFRLKPGTEFMIIINISAIKHYMFCSPVYDNFARVYDIDHKVHYESFPVLYLVCE